MNMAYLLNSQSVPYYWACGNLRMIGHIRGTPGKMHEDRPKCPQILLRFNKISYKV